MIKQEFLEKLRFGLSHLSQDEIEERLIFYSEMIDDRIEEGLSEDEAVSAIGSVDEIVSQIISEFPISKLVKVKIAPKRRLKVWEIVLLILGSPIWLSLLIAAFAVIISVYVSMWSVIVSCWAVFVSCIGCFVGGILGGIATILCGHGLVGLITVGMGFICAGLSIFSFYGCKLLTKWLIILTKKVILSIKKGFIKKEGS